MRPLTARARLSLGSLLRRAGDVDARRTLEEARASFSAMGVRFWERSAQAELDALG
jgi:hypothetical protein